MVRKPEWWRRHWIESAIFVASISVLHVALYLFSVIDLNGLTHGILWSFAAAFVYYEE